MGKIGPILPPLLGLMAGRQADKMWVRFKTFKILYRLNYSDFYFVYYHCNVTTVLKLHFSGLLPSKAYFKVYFQCEKSVTIFYVNPYYKALVNLMISVIAPRKQKLFLTTIVYALIDMWSLVSMHYICNHDGIVSAGGVGSSHCKASNV